MNQYKKIGLVGGVSWISTLEYYQAICEMSHRCKHGITGILPNKGDDQDEVISLIDLLQAEKSNRGSEQLQNLAGKYLRVTSDEPSAVCLSCTELSLAFPEYLNVPIFKINGISYMNTILIHAKAAFDYANFPKIA